VEEVNGKGVNISTLIYVSRYTGKLMLYEGVRYGKHKFVRSSVVLGDGLSEEDMKKYGIGEFRPRPKKFPKKRMNTEIVSPCFLC